MSFNADAELRQALTTDRDDVYAALSSITAARQTCLVCAVDVASTELASDRRNRSNRPVIILLTDGQSNPRPASEAVDRAAEAKRTGVIIFTIGLGDELDFDALEAIASRPGYFFHTPSGDDLEAIYREIAVTIPCPERERWGKR